MKNPKVRQIILPLITAMIWGSSFVTQSLSAGHLGCFSFNALRSIPAALALLLLLLVVRRIRPREKYTAEEKRALLRGGLICGFFLTLGVNLQQFGIETTTAGKAGFITTLYIVLVPVFSIMLGKKAKKSTWIYVLFAVAGLYFLCFDGGALFCRPDFQFHEAPACGKYHRKYAPKAYRHRQLRVGAGFGGVVVQRGLDIHAACLECLAPHALDKAEAGIHGPVDDRRIEGVLRGDDEVEHEAIDRQLPLEPCQGVQAQLQELEQLIRAGFWTLFRRLLGLFLGFFLFFRLLSFLYLLRLLSAREQPDIEAQHARGHARLAVHIPRGHAEGYDEQQHYERDYDQKDYQGASPPVSCASRSITICSPRPRSASMAPWSFSSPSVEAISGSLGSSESSETPMTRRKASVVL